MTKTLGLGYIYSQSLYFEVRKSDLKTPELLVQEFPLILSLTLILSLNLA